MSRYVLHFVPRHAIQVFPMPLGPAAIGREALDTICHMAFGTSLAHHLAGRGMSICILSRHRPEIDGPWEFMEWDACSLGEWISCLNGSAAVVNLVGRSVDCVLKTDPELALYGRYVVPQRLLDEGFEFHYPDLSDALENLC